MQKKKKQYWLIFGLTGIIILIDQTLKIWVKTHMILGEEIPLIGDWCLLHFVENEGFAFGMAIGGILGKILLSLFRLIASAVLIWYILNYIKRNGRTAVVAYLSLITAGAVGNLIDCTFYGLIFNASTYSTAQLFPPEGYAPLFQGRVVDMFYFPLFSIHLPEWIPFWGGGQFEFFNAIFNVADAAITIGAFWFIIDQLIVNFKKKKKTEKTTSGKAENPEKNKS
jgi:signal peptidase II